MMSARLTGLALGILSAVIMGTSPAVWAQDDRPADAQQQQRLREEQAQQFRQLAQQGVMGQVIAIGADGRGNIARIGPGMREPIPEQIILTGETTDIVYVIRGHMIYRYRADRELAAEAEADMRSEEEVQQVPAAPGEIVWPDPALVPVIARFAPNSNTLIVLRGGRLLQYSDQLELLAEFDLRTEAEKQRPRVQVRMRPGPPGEPPPPPPQ